MVGAGVGADINDTWSTFGTTDHPSSIQTCGNDTQIKIPVCISKSKLEQASYLRKAGWVAAVIEYLYLATCAECGCHRFKTLPCKTIIVVCAFSSIFRWLTVAFKVTGFLHGVGDSQTCFLSSLSSVADILLERQFWLLISCFSRQAT